MLAGYLFQVAVCGSLFQDLLGVLAVQSSLNVVSVIESSVLLSSLLPNMNIDTHIIINNANI